MTAPLFLPSDSRSANGCAPTATPEEIVQAAAVEHGVRVADIRGRSRLAHIVRARHACWWRLRRQGWSLPAIGREFGVDHTSVLHALRKFRVRVSVEVPNGRSGSV